MLRLTLALIVAAGIAVLGCSSGGEEAGGQEDAGVRVDARGSIDDPSCQVETSLGLEESRAFVPFAPGNRWMYQGRREIDGELTGEYPIDVVALDPVTVDGLVVQPLRTTAFGDRENVVDEYYRIDDTGLYNHGDTDGADSTTPLAAPYLMMDFPVAVCTTFESFHIVLEYEFDVDGDGKKETSDIALQIWLRGLEEVEAATGTFAGSLRVESTVTTTTRTSLTMEIAVSEETSVSWYAPGVGLVRRSTEWSQGYYDGLIVHMELIGFDVGGDARGSMRAAKISP